MAAKNYRPYNTLSIDEKQLASTRAKKIGYKDNEIQRLEFEVIDGKITGTLDKYLLSDIFYTKK